ncbi:MAG: hypothetical protein HY360_02635 [Verrucomicrobia bacterium]|nr:hypothetical protein [Verrucomicrobiota bacterium]
MNPFAFDSAQMRARKETYYRFARSKAPEVFKPDGAYQPATEKDWRISYWLLPALISSPDPQEREFANVIYAAAPMWDQWDVFTTSSIAANLVRERRYMRPDLIKRSEEHLAKFVVSEGARAPSSGANDYVFHGYNDNMPAMSVRAMILSGEVLGRKGHLDQGLFYLEGLCAHFERRGLLSEYTSGTYTPITLAALMDVAECATTKEAREMALACCNRILLDVFGHWHRGTGTMGGAMSRAYVTDVTATLSCMNALMWYLTGDPLCINPLEALWQPDYGGPIHHGRNFAYNLAQFTEFLTPSYETISPGVREWARAPREHPYEIFATTDSGQAGLLGGVKEIQTRAFHQPLYCLGTASETWFVQSGQQLTLYGAAACWPKPQSWKDRVAFWHRTQEGALDDGDLAPAGDGQLTEPDLIYDIGQYHVLQKRGSALVLGRIGPKLLDKDVSQLQFNLVFGTFLCPPDEVVEDGPWHFLRFGDVYVGVRMTGMVEEKKMPVRRVVKNKYLRIETPLIEGRTVKITREFLEWCDFGCVFEIAAKDECGSFDNFRAQCRACAWEFYHCFYRNSRYQGRHGELQIIDSVAAGTVRFMAVDGVVEPKIKLAATGLDPKLTQLFPDGRRIRQRRIAYRPNYIGSPFYKIRQHILETDIPGEK